jgi:hypothetical protein
MNPFHKVVETSKGPVTIRAATRNESKRLRDAVTEDDVSRVVGEILGLDFDLADLMIPEEMAIISEVKALSFGSAALEKNSASGGGNWVIVPIATTARPSAEMPETATDATTVSPTLTPQT